MPQSPSHLLEFFGAECPHCHTMMPLIKKLEDEEGLKIQAFEVWHDKENEKKMQEWIGTSGCMGVPMFVNTKTKEVICGSTDYVALKAWAQKI